MTTRPRPARPTIYDVAREAGVSKSLVSLVLNDSELVSDAKRAAVKTAIDKLGYRPSKAAANLAAMRTKTVGMVIDDFNGDPDVGIAVCSLTAAGVGLNLQAASNVVLAELSWTAAEQTQAIDRVHRIGQDEPVTAWRIIAAHTIDTKIAELIDQKQGLAARALDGEATEEAASESVQLAALMHLLREALGGS